MISNHSRRQFNTPFLSRLKSVSLLILMPLLCFNSAIAQQTTLPPSLPAAVSNHPVARVAKDGHEQWLSMTGLGAGKTWRDLRAGGFWWQPGMEAWQVLPDLPDGQGRLAAQLVSANQRFWFFGGYTVAEDGHEVSTPDVFEVRPGSAAVYQRHAPMPVPVDDAVAVVYQDRYIYLISGWHDVGNVNLVQVFDTVEGRWAQAEPWPGAGVFGHAGGIVDNHLVVCGGAEVQYPAQGARQFVLSEACWQGRIRPDDHRRIDWRPTPAMPEGPRYRSAARGVSAASGSWVLFFGGTHNPYNYNGIGYDGQASKPLDSVLGFHLDQQRWGCFTPLNEPSMDHRSSILLSASSNSPAEFVLIGGMNQKQEVQQALQAWQLSAPLEQCTN